MVRVIALLVVIFGLSLGVPVGAATYYVATTGHDANAGTDAAPWRTLNKGVTKLRPGDTLLVKSGTYAEALLNTIPGGTSWSSPVTVAAYPGHTVTLRPPGGPYVLSFVGASKQYIVVRGLILDAVNVGSYAVIFYGDAGGSGGTFPHHIRLADSEVTHSQRSGVMVYTGSNNHVFTNVQVHHNGSDAYGGHGFYVASSQNVVERCTVFRNHSFGIQVYSSKTDGQVNSNIVRSNRIYNNGGTGLILSDGSGHLASNNVVWGNGVDGIRVMYGGVSNAKVYHNTVDGNQGSGIKIGAATQTEVRNNIVSRNGASAIADAGLGTLLSHNLVNQDPRFVNASAGDFHLRLGSPAINAGMLLAAVPTDMSGVPRTQGGASDLGAYEVGSSGGDDRPPAAPRLRLVLQDGGQ